MRGWKVLAVLGLAISSILGCMSDGVEKGVTVKGKINQGGQILKPAGAQAPGASKVEVIFYPSDPNGVVEQTIADPATGEFTLTGAGKGVKPGAYKVGVFVRGASFDSDDLQGKFNQQNTPISVTIPEDKLGGTHDLGPIDINNPPKGSRSLTSGSPFAPRRVCVSLAQQVIGDLARTDGERHVR